ncbi:ABC transporter permease [Bauldia litoralis]|uniref:ABC transporter permease n=1 Tax=Bauldia litoralis TaxID=665467 RepID=UPI003264D362
MLVYVAGRMAGAALTLLCVSALAFFATALAPGNPAAVLLGTMATPERVEAVTRQLGLDQPLPTRFMIWLGETVQGNLGVSNLSHKPVTGLLRDALPVTLELAGLSLLLAVLVAVPTGLILAQKRDRWWSKPAMAVITLGISVPGFWVGLMLIVLFAVTWRILPSGGYVPVSRGLGLNLRSMILPTLSLAIYLAPALIRFVRVTAQSVLKEPFVDTARAKGLGNFRILFRHVAPNTWINTMTFVGLQLGVLISGAIVIEVIFSLPGIGRLGLNAVLNRDYPVVQGVVLVAAVGYVFVNLAIDLAYGLVDPRVRTR